MVDDIGAKFSTSRPPARHSASTSAAALCRPCAAAGSGFSGVRHSHQAGNPASSSRLASNGRPIRSLASCTSVCSTLTNIVGSMTMR